ncbi:hypothetical protein ACHAWF_006576 [Thalassiosira exigua]
MLCIIFQVHLVSYSLLRSLQAHQNGKNLAGNYNHLKEPKQSCTLFSALPLILGGVDSKQVKARLTDDTLGALLVCMNAAKTIKRLKLTNCYGLTGAGLLPLKGSIALEQMDLSLVGENKNPFIGDNSSLSKEIVIPILDHIVSQEGNSLKHFELHRKWHNKPTLVCDRFIATCNQLNAEQEHCCHKCHQPVLEWASADNLHLQHPVEWLVSERNLYRPSCRLKLLYDLQELLQDMFAPVAKVVSAATEMKPAAVSASGDAKFVG